MVPLPTRKGACPVRILSGWPWLSGWLSAHRGCLGRMSDPWGHAPLFGGLARFRFGLGMAAAGLFVAWKRSPEGRTLAPRRGGARLHITNGMTREAGQKLGGRKSPAVMEAVYSETRTEEVLPEIRASSRLVRLSEARRFVFGSRLSRHAVSPL